MYKLVNVIFILYFLSNTFFIIMFHLKNLSLKYFSKLIKKVQNLLYYSLIILSSISITIIFNNYLPKVIILFNTIAFFLLSAILTIHRKYLI
jgi:hypothetical protein